MIARQLQRGRFFPNSVLAALLACTAAGCDSGDERAASESPAATAPGETLPPIVPAPAVTQASWAPDALEELLAPIALYPDVLLSQILAASVNSQEVLDAGNWLLQNEALHGEQLDAAAQQAGFGPSMRALIQFPTVVDMMCQQLDWTRQLGSAFSSDQKAVLEAVQRLRAQAASAGALKSTPQQHVETKQEGDKVVVEVKPAEPTVIYVPQYDPQVVYAPAPAAPPAQEDTVSTDTAVAAGLLAFGAGVILANAFDDDDYCYPHWGYGAVYFGPRPFYPPAYVYRPAYGPAFRPAYGYRPPPNYRYSYNGARVSHNDVNVNIRNTDNYFNRFSGNQNLRAGGAQSPLRASQQPVAQQRPAQRDVAQRDAAQRDGAGRDDWKGQTSYAGARDGASKGRLDEAAGVQRQDLRTQEAPANRPERSYTDAREGESERQRPREDRGYGEGPSAETRQAQRDVRDMERPAAAEREHAFAGAASADSGSFDRAASARGRASTEGQRSARGGSRRR